DEVVVVVGDGSEPAADQRRGDHERVGCPTLADLVTVRELGRRTRARGADTRDLGAAPRLRDRRAHPVDATVAEVVVPDPLQFTRPKRRRPRRRDSDPWVGWHLLGPDSIA